MTTPTIACIGIVGKNDKPLHISLFPPFLESRLKFSFLINSCLDIFDIRQKPTSVDQELGLLQTVDERLAAYGWLTNTGVKLLILVDIAGRQMTVDAGKGRVIGVSGIKDSDLKPAFRALQTEYIRLLQNPFYTPDEHTPTTKITSAGDRFSVVTDQRFVAEVKRIGDLWAPGLARM